MYSQQTYRLQQHVGRTPAVQSHHQGQAISGLGGARHVSGSTDTCNIQFGKNFSPGNTNHQQQQTRVDHLVNITALHENHFRAVDQKVDDMADKLATLLGINKVHFAKMTNFMEQKFGTAVAISERLIHMAYSNRLSPGALHHDALIKAVKYINDIARNSDMLSFVHQPSDLFLVDTSYIYKPDEKTFVLVLHILLVTPHNLMPLYKFIPLPIHFNFSGNVSVTPEVGATNMIAVGH
jgi:hypothetical protein